jgi:NAD-dependent dihydropyrimidine dehydrogenase PreA subunit
VRRIKELLFETFHIFFRHFNFPCELRLIRIGNPDETSRVFVSGNYTLTVMRLLRKLTGTDCYLLVANSRGSNVWCAVGMNEFSEYDIIDAINVSGLSKLVTHRRLIAPVYAAPGIDVQKVKSETGFTVHWGPTHLNDLPRYIANNCRRTPEMYRVQFGLQDRIEQGLANGTAYGLTILILALIWPAFIFKLIALMFTVFLLRFIFFPIFPEERLWRRSAMEAALVLTVFFGFAALRGFTASQVMFWGALWFVASVLASLDACGGTPVHKTSIKHWLTTGNYLSLFNPVIDPELCINCMQCVLVCPVEVFAARRENVKTVVAVRPNECEECLACVKQCPTDAIFNRSGKWKGDVYSVPNLKHLVTRDASHLREEDRWIGMPTTRRNGIQVVVEEHVAQPLEPQEESVYAG